jgi:hypothetical protein
LNGRSRISVYGRIVGKSEHSGLVKRSAFFRTNLADFGWRFNFDGSEDRFKTGHRRGISSGCNLLAALIAQNLISPSATVVTVFCDDNKKYLTTDLLREEVVQPDYLSPDVKFVGFWSLPRCL